MDPIPKHTLLMVAGLGGAIGTTLAAGLAVPKRENKLSLMTEAAPIKSLGINFIGSERITLGGWDIDQRNLYDAAVELGIVPLHELERARRYLSSIKPRPGITKKFDYKEWFEREVKQILTHADQIQARAIVILTLLPTEPISQQEAISVEWKNIEALTLDTPGVTLSRIYFKLAIELGAHYVNFTPNIAETHQLREMALSKGTVYCGRDGKSGQTFLKTVLAPAFSQRNLMINGWYSTNLLGNKDGLALADPVVSETKKQSKSKCLEEILGYAPGAAEGTAFGHQVHIHYYPPRKDAKESWDNIDFSGYLGEEMQLKLNWLGKDSILAAPMAYDLVRIVELAARTGFRGMLEEVSIFFKSPLSEFTCPTHAFSHQFDILVKKLRYLQQLCCHSADDPWVMIAEASGQQRPSGIYMHASENMVPRSARLAEALDAGGRYSLKPSGEFEKNDIYFANNAPLQLIKENLVARLKEVLSSYWVSVSPLSGLHAADICFSALVKSGDHVLAVSIEHGGHPSIAPMLCTAGATVHWIPFNSDQTIDVKGLKVLLEEVRPSLMVFDISDALREQDLEFIKEVKGEVKVIYDVSQTLGLIMGKAIGNPLAKRADVIVGTTHKTFPGPHKAIIATNDQLIAQRIEEVLAKKVSSDHTDHILGLSAALQEFLPVAKAFSNQCRVNVRRFAANLVKHGTSVVRDVPLDTHQVWVTFPSAPEAQNAYQVLEEGGIFTNLRKLPFGYGWGLRIGLQEITLRGFREEEVDHLAELFHAAISGDSLPTETRDRVATIQRSVEPMMNENSSLSLLLQESIL